MFDPKDMDAAREEFGKLAEILDHAMGDPQMNGTPHVAAVLHLLSQGLLTLARVVFDTTQRDGSGDSQAAWDEAHSIIPTAEQYDGQADA